MGALTISWKKEEEATRKTPCILDHCSNWGMDVHHGLLATETTKRKESKTELLFVAKPSQSYDNLLTFDEADLSPLMINDSKFIPVVNKFFYLGSTITTDLKDGKDVDAHIKKASKAFGSLRQGIFVSKSVSFKAKKAIYTGIILAVLFHGAKAWSITAKALSLLQCFHAQCARAMCRVASQMGRSCCKNAMELPA
eukprot:11966886-Ditylum_brightwellii.AAC.1